MAQKGIRQKVAKKKTDLRGLFLVSSVRGGGEVEVVGPGFSLDGLRDEN